MDQLSEFTYRHFQTVGSTNDEALAWAQAGAPDLAFVYADEQTKGRGRMQRHWITASGSSIALSIIIRPLPRERELLNLFSPLAGLSVLQAVRKVGGLDPVVKWPNDVLIKGSKVCGILCEMIWQGSTLKGLVMGIGINLKRGSVPEDGSLNFPAVSLEEAGAQNLDPLAYIASVVKSVSSIRPLLGTPDFIHLWEENLAYKGEKIRLISPSKDPQEYILKGLDLDGNILVIDSSGAEHHFMAGEISLRPIQADK